MTMPREKPKDTILRDGRLRIPSSDKERRILNDFGQRLISIGLI
jgi:hypothetical protein